MANVCCWSKVMSGSLRVARTVLGHRFATVKVGALEGFLVKRVSTTASALASSAQTAFAVMHDAAAAAKTARQEHVKSLRTRRIPALANRSASKAGSATERKSVLSASLPVNVVPNFVLEAGACSLTGIRVKTTWNALTRAFREHAPQGRSLQVAAKRPMIANHL